MTEHFYYENESVGEDWQVEATSQRLLPIIDAVLSRYGVKVKGCRLFNDPDRTFNIAESNKATIIALLEGESLGDIVFYWNAELGETRTYEPGPWEVRLQALAGL